MSGGHLRAVILYVSITFIFCFDAVLFHGGVNDLSRGGPDFKFLLHESCSFAVSVLSSYEAQFSVHWYVRLGPRN